MFLLVLSRGIRSIEGEAGVNCFQLGASGSIPGWADFCQEKVLLLLRNTLKHLDRPFVAKANVKVGITLLGTMRRPEFESWGKHLKRHFLGGTHEKSKR